MTNYLLIYNLDNVQLAQLFDSPSEALDYINKAIKNAQSIIRGTETQPGEMPAWRIILHSGQAVELKLEAYPQDELRYYLDYIVDGERQETRSFSQKDYAFKYARKTLKEKHKHRTRYDEEFSGLWEAKAKKQKQIKAAKMRLYLVLIDQAEEKADETNDYLTLGIKEDASDTEVKKAYHKLSKIYHPDMPTGDKDKFQEIEEAYQRIKDKKAKRGSKKPKAKVRQRYPYCDFVYFMSDLANNAAAAYMHQQNKELLMGILQIIGAFVIVLIALLVLAP